MQGGFMTDEYTRRLPVYLLLDCSGSMAGNAIIAVNEGLWMIYHLLMADPQALETVHISVIRFSDHADQYELTPIDKFQPPTLSASGMTAMGAALRLAGVPFAPPAALRRPSLSKPLNTSRHSADSRIRSSLTA